MTEYSDVPDVSALYQQREIVSAAITTIDGGGNLTSITIAPTGAPGMPVMMPPPTPPETLADIRAWLVTRQADIDAQLAALGVVNPPPAAT
jgi:hypothetical protein